MALAKAYGYDKFMKGFERDRTAFGEAMSGMAFMPPLETGELEFDLPPNQHPKTFIEETFNNVSGPSKLHFAKGTTTLAFVYEPETANDKGGIVIATDSRATGGGYIASATVMKVLEVSDHIVATMAGGAADCQFWIRNLAKQCRLFELQNKQKISVAAASKLFANMIYYYKGAGLSIGSIVAGFDKRGAQLYFVDSEGTRVQGKLFSCGSGSLNAYGILDSFVKPTMTDKAALELGQKAIMHATFRDAGSGGLCTLYHVTADGQKFLGQTDVSEMYYKHLDEIGRETFQPTL